MTPEALLSPPSVGSRPLARWEHGSEFHWPGRRQPEDGTTPSRLFEKPYQLYGSGRQALLALTRLGRAERGWRRIWMPAYFCQEVLASLLLEGIEVRIFSDGPLGAPVLPPLRRGDVLFLVNFFGIRPLPAAADEIPGDVDLVEDHTHDPFSRWARNSRADFCVASLRKTLPLPDGGVLWSPAGNGLPATPEPTGAHTASASHKLAAMVLKELYLSGQPVSKSRFRELNRRGEAGMDAYEPAAMSAFGRDLLRGFPIEAWRKTRRRNHRRLIERLAGLSCLRALRDAGRESCPFSVLLVIDTESRRNALREALRRRAIYPAILWPLEKAAVEDIPARYRALSRRILSLHCDMRYEGSDMERVGQAVVECLQGTVG